jgi:hypothetical protein
LTLTVESHDRLFGTRFCVNQTGASRHAVRNSGLSEVFACEVAQLRISQIAS